MLERASGSLPIDPGHPPAPSGGLGYQEPNLVLGPRKPLGCRQLHAAWSKRYDPLLRHEVKGAHGLGSLGQQTGTSEPPPDGLAGETQTLAQPLRFLRRGPLNRTPRILMHDSDCKRSEAYTPDIR